VLFPETPKSKPNLSFPARVPPFWKGNVSAEQAQPRACSVRGSSISYAMEGIRCCGRGACHK
jgi:hypothetical protein